MFRLALPLSPISLPLILSIFALDFPPNSLKSITCKVFSPLIKVIAFSGEKPLPIAVTISIALNGSTFSTSSVDLIKTSPVSPSISKVTKQICSILDLTLPDLPINTAIRSFGIRINFSKIMILFPQILLLDHLQ